MECRVIGYLITIMKWKCLPKRILTQRPSSKTEWMQKSVEWLPLLSLGNRKKKWEGTREILLTDGVLSVFHMKNFIIHVKEALNHAHPQKCPFWQYIKQETNIKKEKKSSCQVISEAVTSCLPFAICCQTDLSIYHGPGFFQLSHDLPSVNCCWLLLSDTGLHLCRGTMSLLLSGPSWQQTADVLSPNLSGKRAEDKSDYFSLTYLFLKLDVSFFFSFAAAG